MREFITTVREGLRQGLRRDRRLRRSQDTLEGLSGLKPLEGGLSGIEPVTIPPTDGDLFLIAADGWPWPQYFHTRKHGLLAFKTGLSSIDRDDWSGTPITIYDPLDPPALGTITAGGVWHVADIGDDAWVATNGKSLVYKGVGGGTSANVLTLDVMTTCHHRGRVLFGGISGMAAAWQAWMTANTTLAPSTKNLADSDRMVAWSSIGGGNALWPWQRTDAHVAMLERGDCGFAKVPMPGTVLSILSLGKIAIVYGTDGVCSMTPVAEPMPTYGFEQLAGMGIPCRGAVGGNEDHHLMIDHSGEAWMVTPKGIERLGYREYFNPMLGEEIVVTWDDRESQFRICSDSAGFLLSGQGLTRIGERVSSTVFAEGGTVGTSDGGSDGTWTLETGPFDLDLRELKVISAIEIGGYGLDSPLADPAVALEVSVGWLQDGSWRWSRWQRANSEGWVMPGVAGVDLKIRLKGTASAIADAKIDFINIRAKLIDNRSIRSPPTENE